MVFHVKLDSNLSKSKKTIFGSSIFCDRFVREKRKVCTSIGDSGILLKNTDFLRPTYPVLVSYTKIWNKHEVYSVEGPKDLEHTSLFFGGSIPMLTPGKLKQNPQMSSQRSISFANSITFKASKLPFRSANPFCLVLHLPILHSILRSIPPSQIETGKHPNNNANQMFLLTKTPPKNNKSNAFFLRKQIPSNME